MAEKDKRTRVYHVFEAISRSYDGANERISLGLEGRWKRTLVDAVVRQLPPQGTVLDVCCGTGDIALAIQQQRTDAVVTGLDFSPAMLAVAANKSQIRQRRIHWQRGDALHLPFPANTFSAVSISFGLRNTTDYGQALREMQRVTIPGGRCYCLDSYVPDKPLIRPFYAFYFRYVMPLLGGGLHHYGAYRWLWQSTQQFLRSRQVTELLQLTGWTDVEAQPFLFGSCVLHRGQKPG